MTGSVECVCYNKTYQECGDELTDGAFVFVEAVTKRADESSPPALMIEKVIPLESVREHHTEALHIHLYENELKEDTLSLVAKLVRRHHGSVPTVLCVIMKNGKVVFIEPSRDFAVRVTPALIEELDRLLGRDHYRIKASDRVPVVRPRFSRPEWMEEKKETAAT